MKYLYIVLLGLLIVVSCKKKEEPVKEWVFARTIQLDGVNPIGIAEVDGKLWLSDGDHNRLVQIDAKGKIEQTVDSLERPMHIDVSESILFVPQYGSDDIFNYNPVDPLSQLPVFDYPKDSLDAPAGIAVLGKEKAIADFYNNRILYTDGAVWISIGKEGKAEGEFYYPTDVQLTDSLIWVADAYNNRVQAFDKQGNFVKMMGQDQKMNAATGIFVSDEEVFVTDFENDRVLVFDHRGTLKQELRDGIDKPTDMVITNGILYVINYRKGEIKIFQLKTKKVTDKKQSQ